MGTKGTVQAPKLEIWVQVPLVSISASWTKTSANSTFSSYTCYGTHTRSVPSKHTGLSAH